MTRARRAKRRKPRGFGQSPSPPGLVFDKARELRESKRSTWRQLIRGDVVTKAVMNGGPQHVDVSSILRQHLSTAGYITTEHEPPKYARRPPSWDLAGDAMTDLAGSRYLLSLWSPVFLTSCCVVIVVFPPGVVISSFFVVVECSEQPLFRTRQTQTAAKARRDFMVITFSLKVDVRPMHPISKLNASAPWMSGTSDFALIHRPVYPCGRECGAALAQATGSSGIRSRSG